MKFSLLVQPLCPSHPLVTLLVEQLSVDVSHVADFVQQSESVAESSLFQTLGLPAWGAVAVVVELEDTACYPALHPFQHCCWILFLWLCRCQTVDAYSIVYGWSVNGFTLIGSHFNCRGATPEVLLQELKKPKFCSFASAWPWMGSGHTCSMLGHTCSILALSSMLLLTYWLLIIITVCLLILIIMES